MKFYLRLEGVNLNNFVYETSDLSTIRGGSLLLLQAVKDIQTNVAGLTEISTGASVGLFSFEVDDEDRAKEKRDEVENYLKKTNFTYRHATFVADITLVENDEEFQKSREAVLALNRWRQMTAPQVTVPEHNDEFPSKDTSEICVVDKLRPAKAKRKFKDDIKDVSTSVAARRDYGFAEKQTFIKTELDHIRKDHLVKYNFAWDFDQITRDGSKGNLNQKMAVIYFDGNGFSGIQSGLANQTELKKFDGKIKEYRREWLASLVEQMNNEEDWQVEVENERTKNLEDHYRMEVLLWGGDDSYIVVPAWKGWETLADFFATSKGWENPANPKEKLKHAAGIAFCHHNAPIRRIKDLVKELCEKKAKCNRDKNQFVYEILESFDHIGKSLDSYLETRCPFQQDGTRKGINESLILDGAMMQAVNPAMMQQLKDTLPRRKLVKLVQILLNGDSLPDIGKPLQDLLVACNSLLPKDGEGRIVASQETDNLKMFISALRGDADVWMKLIENPDDKDLVKKSDDANPVWWIHINALWDYIG
ncbi:MAG: hypothetical protein AB1757_09250 [Acidobacteriota bacterium]